MMLEVARFVNLVLAGLLAGNELGTKAAVHPVLERLGTPERIRAEQEVTRRYAALRGDHAVVDVLGRRLVRGGSGALARDAGFPPYPAGSRLLYGDARLNPDRQRPYQRPRSRTLAGGGRRGVRGVARPLGQATHPARRADHYRVRAPVRGSARRGPRA